MDFRGHFVLLLVASVTFSNLTEAITMSELEKEADGSMSFTEALEEAKGIIPQACEKYKSVIDEAEMTMIIAYTTATDFHVHLNAYVRGDRNGYSFPKAKAALSKALTKLGDHQRKNRISWEKLYRAENSADVLSSYRSSESTGEGKLVQFTSTSTSKQVAERWQQNYKKDYLTTFLSPSSGAYLEDCTAAPDEYEVLLPIDTPYKVTKGGVQENSATLNLDIDVSTTTTTAEPKSSNCFPAKTELLTQNRGVKYIEDVEIGDEVQVISPDGSVAYSEVWCHGHYDPNSTSSYLEITTQTHVLPISHRHYLPVVANSTIIYKMAQDVQVGDFLMTTDGDRQLIEMVQHMTKIERKGAFAPFTKSGHILVNGIQASCYSEVYPTTAHVGLAPFRAAYDVTPRAIMDLILAPNSNGVPYVFDAILNTMSPFIAQGSAGSKETRGLSNLFRPLVNPVS